VTVTTRSHITIVNLQPPMAHMQYKHPTTPSRVAFLDVGVMSQSLPLVNMPSSHSGLIVNGVNGHLPKQELSTLEDLESELPVVNNDQIPLSEVLSRVVQDIYAELLTLADTSDPHHSLA
jgi:hypothetical protein